MDLSCNLSFSKDKCISYVSQVFQKWNKDSWWAPCSKKRGFFLTNVSAMENYPDCEFNVQL